MGDCPTLPVPLCLVQRVQPQAPRESARHLFPGPAAGPILLGATRGGSGGGVAPGSAHRGYRGRSTGAEKIVGKKYGLEGNKMVARKQRVKAVKALM